MECKGTRFDDIAFRAIQKCETLNNLTLDQKRALAVELEAAFQVCYLAGFNTFARWSKELPMQRLPKTKDDSVKEAIEAVIESNRMLI